MVNLRDHKPWSDSDIPYSTFDVERSMFDVRRSFCIYPNARTNLPWKGGWVYGREQTIRHSGSLLAGIQEDEMSKQPAVYILANKSYGK